MCRFFRFRALLEVGCATASFHPFENAPRTAIHPATSHPRTLPVFPALVKRGDEVGITSLTQDSLAPGQKRPSPDKFSGTTWPCKALIETHLTCTY